MDQSVAVNCQSTWFMAGGGAFIKLCILVFPSPIPFPLSLPSLLFLFLPPHHSLVPFHSLSLHFPIPFPNFPSPPSRSLLPYCGKGVCSMGERLSSRSESGRTPDAGRFLSWNRHILWTLNLANSFPFTFTFVGHIFHRNSYYATMCYSCHLVAMTF